MKTSLTAILLVLLFICNNRLLAQQTKDPGFKRFGFQAGVNISNMNFNKGTPAPIPAVPASWQTGFSLGFLMRVPLGEKWLLQPEYNYNQKSGNDKTVSTSYRLDYFSMPVLLHYKINQRFSLYAGPQAELLIHAASNKNGIKTNITHDTEERSLAAVGGIEVQIARSFFLSARYAHGLNHIGIGQRSAVKEFKYESVGLTAGVSF